MVVRDAPEEVTIDPAEVERLRLSGRDVPDAVARRNAAEALGRIGDVTSIPSLIDALTDNDAAVAAMAHWSLVEMTGRSFKTKIKSICDAFLSS